MTGGISNLVIKKPHGTYSNIYICNVYTSLITFHFLGGAPTNMKSELYKIVLKRNDDTALLCLQGKSGAR